MQAFHENALFNTDKKQHNIIWKLLSFLQHCFTKAISFTCISQKNWISTNQRWPSLSSRRDFKIIAEQVLYLVNLSKKPSFFLNKRRKRIELLCFHMVLFNHCNHCIICILNRWSPTPNSLNSKNDERILFYITNNQASISRGQVKRKVIKRWSQTIKWADNKTS